MLRKQQEVDTEGAGIDMQKQKVALQEVDTGEAGVDMQKQKVANTEEAGVVKTSNIGAESALMA